MEQELSMLRHLIAQLQDLLNFYGSPPPPPPPFLGRHHNDHLLLPQNGRCCVLYVEDGSADDYCGFLMATEKPETFTVLDPTKPPRAKKLRKECSTRGKFPCSISTTEAMEAEIWKDFPKGLFQSVIAKLPVPTFIQFRSVCKKWNSLLHYESFSHHSARAPQPDPWFYTMTHENTNSGAMFDPSSKKWYHHPTISSLPG